MVPLHLVLWVGDPSVDDMSRKQQLRGYSVFIGELSFLALCGYLVSVYL